MRKLILVVICLSVALLLATQVALAAQPWDGILDPGRAIDWSQAGIPGGIPSSTWANCITTQCNTLYGGTVTAASITAALASAPNNTVVRIPAGTWTLNSPVYGNRGYVVLRGAGPTQTTLTLGTGSCADCVNLFFGQNGTGGQGGYPNGPYYAVNWTDGLTKGSTTLTVASTANMHVGQTIQLDQFNDVNLVFPTGNEGTQNGGRNETPSYDPTTSQRLQYQLTEITQVVDATHIVIAQPVDYTHNPSLSPKVFLWNTGGTPAGNIKNVGVENLKINADPCRTANPTTSCGQERAIAFTWCSNCWVKNVEVKNTDRGAIMLFFNYQSEIRDSYISAYGALAGPTQYGFEIINSTLVKLENNIAFNITAPIMPMTDNALVAGYNYAHHIFGPDNQFAAFEPHQSHSYNHLYEGNVTYGIGIDNVWGSASQLTMFRNRVSGYAPNKTYYRNPLSAAAHQRYMNYVGNVLGTLGFHTRYQVDNADYSGDDNFVYSFGFWNRWELGIAQYDAVTKTSAMRWGNWDSATNAVRWCIGATSPCTGSETASTEPRFPGLANPNTTLPPSFYLANKPSWFGSVPWPPIGPDVTCTANCIANTASHAAMISAQLCYENGAKDANGYLTAFDANTCYAAASILYGDVSENGSVTAYDASLGAQYAVGLITLTASQLTKADVSGNGSVTAYDASLIAQYAVGLITKFPVQG